MHVISGFSRCCFALVAGLVFWPLNSSQGQSFSPILTTTRDGSVLISDPLTGQTIELTDEDDPRADSDPKITERGNLYQVTYIDKNGEVTITLLPKDVFDRARIEQTSRDATAETLPSGSQQITVPLSHAGDAGSLTCNGQFYVACAATGNTPLSVVDVNLGLEIDTVPLTTGFTSVAITPDSSSVLLTQFANGFLTGIQRYTLSAAGQLTSTGEFLNLPGARNVYVPKNSSVGLCFTQVANNSQIVTFSIPGLQVIDSVTLSGDLCWAVGFNCETNAIYGRSGDGSQDDIIEGFSFNPDTGDLGDQSFVSYNVGSTFFTSFAADNMALSEDGTRLYVCETDDNNLKIVNAPTGATIRNFPFGDDTPTNVLLASCCGNSDPSENCTLSVKLLDGPDRDGNGKIDFAIPTLARTPSAYEVEVSFTCPAGTNPSIGGILSREWEVVSISSDNANDVIVQQPTGPAVGMPRYRQTIFGFQPAGTSGKLTVKVQTRPYAGRWYLPANTGNVLITEGIGIYDSDFNPILDQNDDPISTGPFNIQAFDP